MIESVAVRQRGAYDFETHYNNLCALQNSCPIPAVKAHLACGKLDINGDRMRTTDWMPILNTLRINKTLSCVSVHSYYQQQLEDEERQGFRQKKIPAIRSKEITYRLCKALKECLWVTPALTSLELHGLPLRSRDLTALAKGMMKNCTLKHISLEGSRVADEGLEIICKGVKNSTSVTSLDFSGCSLGWKGADILAKVIKHQAMKRHNEAWQDSLRYRRPDLDRMSGVRRITINSNPMIGDQGAARLAEALKDDLWLKALDLQQSGLTNKGANALLDVLKYNTTIVVLDVRQNPMIDAEILRSIMEQVVINSNGQDSQYKWIKAPPLQDGANKSKQRRRRTKTLQCSFGKKTTIKISASVGRRRSRSMGAAVSQPPLGPGVVKPGPGMPWRTAMRAARFRGYPPENIPPHSGMYELGSEEGSGTTSPETTVRIECSPRPSRRLSPGQPRRTRKNLSDSEIMTEFRSMKEVKVELEQLRRRLREETTARSKAEERMIEVTLENSRLKKCLDDYRARGSLLDDDSVLESIETSFQQFHAFLDMLRDAGLGQLINLAGIDQSKMPFPRAATSTPLAYPPASSQPAPKAATSQPPVISIQSPVLPSVDEQDREQRLREQDREQRLREQKQQDFQSELAQARTAANTSYIPASVFPQNFQNGRDPTMQHPTTTSSSSDMGRPKATKFDELYQQCLNETEGVLSQTRQEIGLSGPPTKPSAATAGPEGDAPPGGPPLTLPKPANGWQVQHDDAHSDNQSERSQHQQRSHASSQHSVRSQHSSQPNLSQRSGGRSRRSEKSKSAPGDGEGHYSETFEKSVSEISEQLEMEELAAVSVRSDKTANSDNDTF